MESDEVIPLAAEKMLLEELSMKIEDHLQPFRQQVYADAYMSDRGVEQVHVDEIEVRPYMKPHGLD